MMSDPLTLDPEELGRNAEWVRILARRLVADEHFAADAAQDTWVAAMQHPVDQRSASRPWLATVLHNIIRTRLRGDRRRVERECVTATVSEGTSAGEIAGQVESLRLLVNAVMSLEEPIRSTILLRYYEDLSAAEIARRNLVPAGTVRSRLKRGLDILRARLDAEHDGDRQAWCLALLPMLEQPAASVTASSAAAWPGGAIMSGKALVAVGAAIMLGVSQLQDRRPG